MLPPILHHIEEAGYKVFTSGPYDLNLFGIRAPDSRANTFNDFMGCAYQNENMSWVVEYWEATCDPGTYWLENYNEENVSGTAILIPDR